ncbi:MAG: DUF2786 domain-containing protein [Euzebya sp.]
MDQVADDVATQPVRLATLPQAIDVLGLIMRLVSVPPAVSQRDEAIPAGLNGQMLGKVRALLRKAESTGFDAEAEALTAKAHQLITRHAIDEAQLGSDPGVDPTGVRRILLNDPYLDAKAMLVASVADASRCNAVNFKTAGWSTVFGHRADLDAVDLLVASLLAQAVGTMARLGPQRDAQGRSRTRSFRAAPATKSVSVREPPRSNHRHTSRWGWTRPTSPSVQLAASGRGATDCRLGETGRSGGRAAGS